DRAAAGSTSSSTTAPASKRNLLMVDSFRATTGTRRRGRRPQVPSAGGPGRSKRPAPRVSAVERGSRKGDLPQTPAARRSGGAQFCSAGIVPESHKLGRVAPCRVLTNCLQNAQRGFDRGPAGHTCAMDAVSVLLEHGEEHGCIHFHELDELVQRLE